MLKTIVVVETSENAQILKEEASTLSFPLSAEDEAIIEALKNKLITIGGVGLAAPQVGVAKQIIAIHISEDAAAVRQSACPVPLTVLINPSYTPHPETKLFYDWEGCFSVSETMGKVPRYDRISYKAQSEDGKLIEKEATGFTARVLQHEIDHVHGTLILDRLTDDCVQGAPAAMQELRMKELSPEQQEIARKILANQAKKA